MKKLIPAIVALVIVALMALGYMDAEHHSRLHPEAASEPLNVKATLFGHLGDAYGWEVPFNHSTRIPLPVIVRDHAGSWHVFSSDRVTGGATYDGFKIVSDPDSELSGKIVEVLDDGSEVRPWDLSITKNVACIFIAALIVIAVVMSLRRWYDREGMKAPRGGRGFVELIVDFVYFDTIRPIMGKHAPRFAPYLLTAFFMILTLNLLGLIVIFPGGANVTGNIAVTMVLALCTFALTTFNGTREYWKEIFWPEVPVWLKCPVPLMPFIEFLGIFTKPLALMIRLFANMMSGHMVVIVLVTFIFLFAQMFGTAVGGMTVVFSMAFSLFMLLLDTLISFIQAYVFTLLSALFISMALVEPHHVSE
ncbi:MAG: F0F1 ATP synthase subunit A [Muribaculaceae bacterium]|nr:F0F1 ATP synthase subunit A [Muribaculaceae bacterium]